MHEKLSSYYLDTEDPTPARVNSVRSVSSHERIRCAAFMNTLMPKLYAWGFNDSPNEQPKNTDHTSVGFGNFSPPNKDRYPEDTKTKKGKGKGKENKK